MSCGPLDELIALHDELGVFDALGEVKYQRQRAGSEYELQLRTIEVLPVLEAGSLSGAVRQLFQEPAILLHLGWSPLQLQTGDDEHSLLARLSGVVALFRLRRVLLLPTRQRQRP